MKNNKKETMQKRTLPKGAKIFSLSFEDQSKLQMLYLFRQLDMMHLEGVEQNIQLWKMGIAQRFAIDPASMAIDLSSVFDPHKPEVVFIPKPEAEAPAPTTEVKE